MVALESIVVRSDGVLGAVVDGETVLMSVERGDYYALTATSCAIWEQLETPVRVRDLCRTLADAYKAPLETVQADTLEFLSYLAVHKLIESRITQDS